MQARVRLTVRKDVRVTAPEFRTAGPLGVSTNTAGWYAADGVGPDLLTAAREATSPDDRPARRGARPGCDRRLSPAERRRRSAHRGDRGHAQRDRDDGLPAVDLRVGERAGRRRRPSTRTDVPPARPYRRTCHRRGRPDAAAERGGPSTSCHLSHWSDISHIAPGYGRTSATVVSGIGPPGGYGGSAETSGRNAAGKVAIRDIWPGRPATPRRHRHSPPPRHSPGNRPGTCDEPLIKHGRNPARPSRVRQGCSRTACRSRGGAPRCTFRRRGGVSAAVHRHRDAVFPIPGGCKPDDPPPSPGSASGCCSSPSPRCMAVGGGSVAAQSVSPSPAALGRLARDPVARGPARRRERADRRSSTEQNHRLDDLLAAFDDMYDGMEAERQLLVELRKPIPTERPTAEAYFGRLQQLAVDLRSGPPGPAGLAAAGDRTHLPRLARRHLRLPGGAGCGLPVERRRRLRTRLRRPPEGDPADGRQPPRCAAQPPRPDPLTRCAASHSPRSTTSHDLTPPVHRCHEVATRMTTPRRTRAALPALLAGALLLTLPGVVAAEERDRGWRRGHLPHAARARPTSWAPSATCSAAAPASSRAARTRPGRPTRPRARAATATACARPGAGTSNPAVLQGMGAALVPYRDPGPAFSTNQLITRDFSSVALPDRAAASRSTPTDPEHLVLGTIDYNFPSNSSYVSLDGGETWEGPFHVPYILDDLGSGGDPVVAFRPRRLHRLHDRHLHRRGGVHGRTGRACSCRSSSISVARSDDGGFTWPETISSARSRVTTDGLTPDRFGRLRGNLSIGFLDKPWIAVGPYPGRPDQGRHLRHLHRLRDRVHGALAGRGPDHGAGGHADHDPDGPLRGRRLARGPRRSRSARP